MHKSAFVFTHSHIERPIVLQQPKAHQSPIPPLWHCTFHLHFVQRLQFHLSCHLPAPAPAPLPGHSWATPIEISHLNSLATATFISNNYSERMNGADGLQKFSGRYFRFNIGRDNVKMCILAGCIFPLDAILVFNQIVNRCRLLSSLDL